MQTQRHKMGVYKTIGVMNDRLVYEQANPKTKVNYAFSWKDAQGLLRW